MPTSAPAGWTAGAAGVGLLALALYNLDAAVSVVGVAWGLVIASRRGQEQRSQIARASKMTCQHCRTSGSISAKPVTVKDGISGGRAAAGVVTGGASVLVTGLSQRKNQLRYVCGTCGGSWHTPAP